MLAALMEPVAVETGVLYVVIVEAERFEHPLRVARAVIGMRCETVRLLRRIK